jgi:type 1 fimbria pilin
MSKQPIDINRLVYDINQKVSNIQDLKFNDGRLLVSSNGGGGGGAVQIEDSNGNPLLGTDNALNVNIVSGGSDNHLLTPI